MKSMNLDRITFIGRTFREYMSIFDLEKDIIGKGPVLDCAAGPSSFAAEAGNQGFDVSAYDVLYDLAPFDLFKKGVKDIQYVFDKFNEVADSYVWNYYRDKEDVIARRKLALGQFIRDYTRKKHTGKYRRAALPELPCPDDHFALVLSSHFLFLYSDRLDIDFHKACLKELMRVCSGEIRIFPLTGLDAEPYPHLDDILLWLTQHGGEAEIVRVPFEFQRGSNRMMVIRKKRKS